MYFQVLWLIVLHYIHPSRNNAWIFIFQQTLLINQSTTLIPDETIFLTHNPFLTLTLPCLALALTATLFLKHKHKHKHKVPFFIKIFSYFFQCSQVSTICLLFNQCIHFFKHRVKE